MNTVLIWFSQYLIKLEYLDVDISDINIFIKAQLQPNTIVTNFRMLFSVFSDNSIQYSIFKDFNQIGKSVCFLFFFVIFTGRPFNFCFSLKIFSISSPFYNSFHFLF